MTNIFKSSRTTANMLKASVAPVVLGMAMISAPAYAQDEDELALADTSENMIIVTGSRIASDTIVTTAPVQILGQEAIQDSGVTNIQAVLLENPAFGAPAVSRVSSSFNSSTSGVATIDLRNLGTARTLVLINGRRVVAGIPNSSAVDLNMIATPLIERVEVLTSGSGSAIYGSDAVAGVVNFIYRDDFEGIDAGGLVGITEQGDDFRYQADVLVGANFADGRGNVTMFIGYTNEEGAFKTNRRTEQGSSALDSVSLGLLTGVNSDLFLARVPFFSSFPPQGRYTTDNFTFTQDQNGLGPFRPCFSTNGGTAPATCGAFAGQQIGPDGFNRSGFRLLASPVERYMFGGSANYEITPGVTFFAETQFTSSRPSSNVEPFPASSPDAYNSGQYPIETLDPLTGLIVRNPFVPDAIYNDTSDNDGDGLRDLYFARRMTDFGPRRTDASRATFRIVAGLRGEFIENWSYELFGNYGQTDITQRGNGQYNELNFRNAAQIVPDGNGGFQCADQNARNDGCVPVNIFGLNSFANDPAALAYLAAPQLFNAAAKQTQVGANVTGQLWEFAPGHPIGITVGAEYRRESSFSMWDPLQAQGLNASNAFPATSGSFDVREGYGELLVPILRDSFIHDLTLRGAVRVSDYSTVGGTFSWNVGGEFAPIEDIRFRGTYSETVRAPNIGELFSGRNQTFPQVQDPCEGITNDGSALANNCLAAPGVAGNLAANGGVFFVSQPDRQGVTGFGGGNPALEEETGKTYTLGVTINPVSIPALRNLTLSVDYFNIEIQQAIVNTPRQFILDQCYTQGVQAFCGFVVRHPQAQGLTSSGALDEVNTGPSNSGGFATEGIDFVLGYNDSLSLGSRDLDIGFRVAYTHLLESFLIPLPGSAPDRFDGEIGSAVDRFTTNLNLGLGDWRLSLTGTYIGESFLDDQFTGVLAGTDNDFRVHPEFYLDSQVRFSVNDTAQIFIGVDNIFDNVPVFMASIPGGADAGQEVAGGVYDPLGRRYYAGARLRF